MSMVFSPDFWLRYIVAGQSSFPLNSAQLHSGLNSPNIKQHGTQQVLLPLPSPDALLTPCSPHNPPNSSEPPTTLTNPQNPLYKKLFLGLGTTDISHPRKNVPSTRPRSIRNDRSSPSNDIKPPPPLKTKTRIRWTWTRCPSRDPRRQRDDIEAR